MVRLTQIDCPDYVFGEGLDLERVCKCIDEILISNFQGKQVVIRGIQSEKHELAKEELVEQIMDSGTDKYESDSADEVKVNDERVDIFGYECVIDSVPIVLPVLEGFHKWKPKSLERPQRKIDVWMVYDAAKLENVEYTHGQYGVKAKDGYIFREPTKAADALLGVIVVD